MTKTKCKSCGVKWTDHNGIQRTCAALQVAIKALEQISVMPRNRRARHLAIGARSFIETQLLPPNAELKHGGDK